MKLVYIAGAYRAPSTYQVVQNIRVAERVAVKYWRRGYAVICPHMNSALLDGIMPDESWLAGGIEILSRCDIIVMVPGWEKSHGAKKELKFAQENGLEIIWE